MAFQSSALPNFAAATSELWPSMSNAMAVRRVLGAKSQRAQSSHIQRRSILQAGIRSFSSSTVKSSKVELPQSTQDLSICLPSHLAARTRPRNAFDIRQTVSAMPWGTFAAANPTSRRMSIFSFQSRQISTASQSQFQKSDILRNAFANSQRRTLFGGNNNRNLASLEETANRNPTSATAQNAFYQALIRANMPAIVVERYQTNSFASNAACENAYHRALGAVGTASNAIAGQTGNLNNSQLQAIGQAVAAQSQGANLSTARNQGTAGTADSPLRVVVEETIGSIVFKWIKFIFYFGLVVYLSMVGVALILETFSSFKKAGAGGKTDNEAKAEHQNVRFADVHGCDEAKEELQELVEFLKNPEKFSTLGGKLPKGVLLVGPPGTGKTLLARAVAGEAGVPFFFMSGSEFDEVYVGVGAKRVRELFAAAKGKSPAIVFIDELDAIGGKRNARDAAYVKQTLNQLLTELDGFEQNSGVIILAATNFPELLDKALTRPGRFDRNVVVPLPDVRGRMAILKHHMKNVVAGNDVSLEQLAQGTPGFSGAELENVINQAAVHASKAKAKAVSMFDFEWAKDKVMMGAENKSKVITQKEKEMTAYHEAGHALCVMFTPGADALHKITIMPRGRALGMTMHLPEMDKYSKGMDEYEAHIDICLGGKVAEELIYGPGKVTSGCASDLQQATQLAYAMVTSFGMSEKLGNVDLASNHDSLSAGTKLLIEAEVRRLIEESRERATKLLKSKRKELEYLAKALVDYETLDKEEAFKVIKGEKLDGKTIMPSGNIRVPPMGGLDGGQLPGIPPIPGTEPDKGDTKEPPQSGGAIA
ncbi:Mitochondrial inner membrane i-AAA protease supercomplex subunit [Lachnellula suecica]|uniref:Mitochondrial inner membrane i-AAA protease supercomplex subunit n=1 Tax=Lachnellula suecica TaxID=602035 RepID=A0A8T9CE06_9HELO|nr:Mitochondrial inner membrane i-AAA protease supercomplex subunit [Lachnellula suecica]